MTAFAPLLCLLEEVPDRRRAEGKLYRLPHLLLFSILAIVSGGNSYRSVTTFIEAQRRRLNRAFGLTWRRAPAHPSIRNILICTSRRCCGVAQGGRSPAAARPQHRRRCHAAIRRGSASR